MSQLTIIVSTIVLVSMAVLIAVLRPEPRQQLPYKNTYKLYGQTMSYAKIGQGPAVILLHGSKHNIFASQPDALLTALVPLLQ